MELPDHAAPLLGLDSTTAARLFSNVVLYVDSDGQAQAGLRALAAHCGFEVLSALTGESALDQARTADIDLALLEMNLSGGVSGTELCRRLRAAGAIFPIMFLSAATNTVDVVVGLEVGGDDYIRKPYEPRELLARIAARLRRQEVVSSATKTGRVRYPGLMIDRARHEVTRGTDRLNLTPTEFAILVNLIRDPGRVVSRQDLINLVWGPDTELDHRSVDAHIYRLRRKLEPDGARPTYVHSVAGIGYCFDYRAEEDAPATAGDPEVATLADGPRSLPPETASPVVPQVAATA